MRKNKRGSALLIAIIIMMVVLLLSLALLLVSYSLFVTAAKQQNMEQCKEMAQSLSRELEEEITGTDTAFKTYADMKQAMTSGKNPLWFYLRFHLWQTDWPYYNAEERGHTSTHAYRYFTLHAEDLEERDAAVLDGITVKMYWESESDAQRDGETPFVIEITCQKGKQKSTITSFYELSVDVPADYGGEGEKLLEHSVYNASRNTIQTDEKWTFSLSQRE